MCYICISSLYTLMLLSKKNLYISQFTTRTILPTLKLFLKSIILEKYYINCSVSFPNTTLGVYLTQLSLLLSYSLGLAYTYSIYLSLDLGLFSHKHAYILQITNLLLYRILSYFLVQAFPIPRMFQPKQQLYSIKHIQYYPLPY